MVFEPVSVPKAERSRTALTAGPVPWAVTPNVAELGALVGAPVPDTGPAVTAAARTLHAHGVEVVWVRRGPRGSVLSGADGVTELPALNTRVVDVTGAGDAMLAAFLAALLAGETPLQAAREGHAAAALTVASSRTVVPDLTRRRVRAALARAQAG